MLSVHIVCIDLSDYYDHYYLKRSNFLNSVKRQSSHVVWKWPKWNMNFNNKIPKLVNKFLNIFFPHFIIKIIRSIFVLLLLWFFLLALFVFSLCYVQTSKAYFTWIQNKVFLFQKKNDMIMEPCDKGVYWKKWSEKSLHN